MSPSPSQYIFCFVNKIKIQFVFMRKEFKFGVKGRYGNLQTFGGGGCAFSPALVGWLGMSRNVTG